MSTFLGIDVGTSSVKAVLVDERERLLASGVAPLQLSHPAPGFSEQNPEDWWTAVVASVDAVAHRRPRELASLAGIGLSGQMHGATLLDRNGAVLRPCILWNDARATQECIDLQDACPDLGRITGNPCMAGFTAPKLLWVRRHEPHLFERIATVLLPKAYVRFRLTGELVEEMSDAAGTLWLDVGRRAWSSEALQASGLSEAQMPRLVEGNAASGRLLPELAARWGISSCPVVAGGAGDNAAGAVGLGAILPGSTYISLGTSGVIWVTTDRFAPSSGAIHAFCHALPQRWHQMGVMLSAAACLTWWAGIVGTNAKNLLSALGDRPAAPSPVLFLPYLSGERTPHNDPAARGLFAGLSHEIGRTHLTQAVLEGVAFGFRDCLDAFRASGTMIEGADVIGGGSRSRFWMVVLASILDIPLHVIAGGEAGAALGAARLGRMAATGEVPEIVCRPPRRLERVEPDSALVDGYRERHAIYRSLYPRLAGLGSLDAGVRSRAGKLG